MADVSPEPDGRGRWTSEDDERRNRDRGQLILVTGLAVAVTLVALVLLLNTVIYTQNLATRGTGVEHGEAVAFRGETASGVGAVVDAENRAGYDDWNGVSTNVRDAVARYDNLSTRYSAERGTIADVEEDSLDLSEGSLLHQTNETRNFTNVGATSDWTVAGNVGSARDFDLTVSGENLSDSRSDAFRVRLVDDDGAWQVYVYNTDDDIAVAVKNGTGLVELACTVSGSEATIDLTAGTVNESACAGLVYATGVTAPYDIEFRNADEVTGTYGVTVDVPPTDSGVNRADFADPDAESSPRWGHAVYDAAFDVHFETATMEFHTRVRVAPGEPE